MNRRHFLGTGGLMAAAPFIANGQQAGKAGAEDAALAAARRSAGGFTKGPIGAHGEGLQPFDGGRIGNTPPMKITDIKTFLVGAGGRNRVYVKILTDQGLFGVGETYSAGPDEATVKVIEDFKSWLIGNDPRNVQWHVPPNAGSWSWPFRR